MPKRVLTGTVVSDKADKTVVVRVERRVKHPLYGKIIRLSKKYHAHDEANAFRTGEQVRIEERAPISKLKTWAVIDRLGAAKAAVVEIADPEALTPEAQPAKPVEAKAEKKPAKAVEEKADKTPAKPAEEKADKKPAEPVEEKADKKPVEGKADKKPAKAKADKPAKTPARKAKAKADDADGSDA